MDETYTLTSLLSVVWKNACVSTQRWFSVESKGMLNDTDIHAENKLQTATAPIYCSLPCSHQPPQQPIVVPGKPLPDRRHSDFYLMHGGNAYNPHAAGYSGKVPSSVVVELFCR